MSYDEIFARCEKLLTMVERLWKLAVALFLLANGGLLWGYRLESARIDHAERLGKVEGKVDHIGNEVAHIKGRLDIAKADSPKRALQAWKGDIPDPEPPQQQ